jgi:hypothetical protein
MDRPTMQEIEALKAIERISYYLGGGSLPVYICRGVIAGVLVVIWIVLWWQR